MDLPFVDRIDAAGNFLPVATADIEAVLRQGEVLHRGFRPDLEGDYVDYIRQMAAGGACMVQLVHEKEVRGVAIWRMFLTTYCGHRFEIDDLVTDEDHRSKGYGATLIGALEAKARSLKCNAVMLTSATWRVDAHRFYFRERYSIDAFQFCKKLS